jgi:hypothetical protein
VVDDADPTADVEDGRPIDAPLADHVNQHPCGRVGPMLAVPRQVRRRGLAVEDLEPPVAAAAVHQSPKIASSSNGTVVSSWS